VNELLIGLLTALIGVNQAMAATNAVKQVAATVLKTPDPNDPVEMEYQKLLADDDAAQEDADKWIRENQAFKEKGAGVANAALSLRIEQRFKPVRKAYEDFLMRHPNHVRARLAYGSFLSDTGDEEEGVAQWEKAREIDPKNPATWNNLANYYGHRGPVTNAFAFYAKAIELNPKEAVYYHNLGTTVFLFRKDAMEFYHIDEQKVFDRALELYAKALELDPDNYVLANDIAQTYYGIKPPRYEAALAAWNYALKTAKDELQREGVYVHLARNEIQMARFAQAHQHLDAVTNETYQVLKQRLVRNLAQKEANAKTNSAPAVIPTNSVSLPTH
jgi:tetratricopeptide (TPR) repeat protein